MSRAKILKLIKEKNKNLSKDILQKILDTFFDNISNSLKNKRKVEIKSLGIFFTKEIKEKKTARNPKTGEIIYVPKKNKARFKPSKKLKETINN